MSDDIKIGPRERWSDALSKYWRASKAVMEGHGDGEEVDRTREEYDSAFAAKIKSEEEPRGADKETWKAWFPDQGQTVEDAEEYEHRQGAREHADIAEEAAEDDHQKSGGEVPSSHLYEVAVLGPGETEPKIFDVLIEWDPVFTAKEKKG